MLNINGRTRSATLIPWPLGVLVLVVFSLSSSAVTLASESEAQAAPRVFFVAPDDGATVSSPVRFEFGLENLTLSPVPEEFEEPRPGVGHHHLGFDTDCLPVGEEIPMADPWVHFGDGSTTFETLLEAGEHSFALQIGDNEHRTLEGLCATITVE